MADTTAPAQAPATDKPAAETNVTEKAGSGTLLTGQTLETATPEAQKGPLPADKAASAPPAQGNDKSGPVELAGFAQAATKELKGDQKFQALASKFKSFDEMARAHMELESRLGNALVPPGENATPEERAAYWAKLGVPEAPDKYELERVPLPEGLDYDEAAAQEFLAKAHELHLSKEQAKELAKWNDTRLARTYEAIRAHQAEQEAVAAADARRASEQVVLDLKSTWGSAFPSELDGAVRTVERFESQLPGLKAELERTGFGNSKIGILLFNALSKQMANHSFVEGEPAPGKVDNHADALFGRSMKG